MRRNSLQVIVSVQHCRKAIVNPTYPVDCCSGAARCYAHHAKAAARETGYCALKEGTDQLLFRCLHLGHVGFGFSFQHQRAVNVHGRVRAMSGHT